jgi:hypothetical protein
MGEDIEVRDVNGNLVRVPLYPTLAAIGERLVDGETKSCFRRDGRGVEVKLAPEPG